MLRLFGRSAVSRWNDLNVDSSLLSCLPTVCECSYSARHNQPRSQFCVSPSTTASSENSQRPETPVQKLKLVHELRRLHRYDEVVTADQRPVYGAAIIERYPICLPEAPQWKKDYRAWKEDFTHWKYKHFSDSEVNCDKRMDDGSQAAYVPEPLITEADTANDIRSLRRKTQGFLYLMYQAAGAEAGQWRFPLAKNSDSETIKETVHRAVHSVVGSSVETHLFGNAPCAFASRPDSRHFFMLGVVLDGNAKIRASAKRDVADYAWLTKSEILEAYAGDSDMQEMINTLLVE